MAFSRPPAERVVRLALMSEPECHYRGQIFRKKSWRSRDPMGPMGSNQMMHVFHLPTGAHQQGFSVVEALMIVHKVPMTRPNRQETMKRSPLKRQLGRTGEGRLQHWLRTHAGWHYRAFLRKPVRRLIPSDPLVPRGLVGSDLTADASDNSGVVDTHMHRLAMPEPVTGLGYTFGPSINDEAVPYRPVRRSGTV
ncbi:hypothetical protein LZ31DRAFT_601271 [Colletotrichum somersetense]|nr:hypothetical protein LZ31DRAFT_601271 [Colletotrichum somersetense]